MWSTAKVKKESTVSASVSFNDVYSYHMPKWFWTMLVASQFAEGLTDCIEESIVRIGKLKLLSVRK